LLRFIIAWLIIQQQAPDSFIVGLDSVNIVNDFFYIRPQVHDNSSAGIKFIEKSVLLPACFVCPTGFSAPAAHKAWCAWEHLKVQPWLIRFRSAV